MVKSVDFLARVGALQSNRRHDELGNIRTSHGLLVSVKNIKRFFF